jgi:ribosomal protein S14
MDGRFVKGEHRSPSTEFKEGQHWRHRKPHWDKEWLENEYVTNGRSAKDIADSEGCTENNILFWLRKHSIPCRSMSAIRKEKHWGASGENNPMWNGGTSSERQTFTNSLEWAWAIRKIYGRDNKTCQRCGRKQTKRFRKFHIHHRVSFREKDLRLNIDNLVLLCAKCHHWVHSNKNKNKDYLGAFQVTLKGVGR